MATAVVLDPEAEVELEILGRTSYRKLFGTLRPSDLEAESLSAQTVCNLAVRGKGMAHRQRL